MTLEQINILALCYSLETKSRLTQALDQFLLRKDCQFTQSANSPAKESQKQFVVVAVRSQGDQPHRQGSQEIPFLCREPLRPPVEIGPQKGRQFVKRQSQF